MVGSEPLNELLVEIIRYGSLGTWSVVMHDKLYVAKVHWVQMENYMWDPVVVNKSP